MRCEDLVRIIINYIEDTMDPAYKEEFERHIGDCSSCHAFFETYKMTRDLTKEIKCDDIPPDIQDKIRAFLKKKISQT